MSAWSFLLIWTRDNFHILHISFDVQFVYKTLNLLNKINYKIAAILGNTTVFYYYSEKQMSAITGSCSEKDVLFRTANKSKR